MSHTPKPAVPALPPGHPLAQRLQQWMRLRGELALLSARLEYLELMLKLERRRR